MIEAAHPANEAERLAALFSYDVLDSEPEQVFDDLTRLAARVCGMPISLVSLIDPERQWFKSKVGLGACETPRRVAFCAHAILDPEDVFVVPDATRDERFADNPLVTDAPNVRFYAGAPLLDPCGLPLGTLCVIDHEPRELDKDQIETLRVLARQVMTQMELRKNCVELGRLAAELQRTNQELKDFNSIAAHDLQEPLRKIMAFGSMLEADLGTELPPRAEDDLRYMVDAAQRMRTLINDLLVLSRTGSAELAMEPIDLRDCVDAALQAVSLRIDEIGATLDVAPMPHVEGDRTLLTQLLQNLISNALKFMDKEQPVITVTAVREGDRHVIGVRDNGIGIDPGAAEQIFAPFKRLHGREAYAGTGIGLAIARKAVERHDGRIWVESEPGVGSHFRFSLPADAKVPVDCARPAPGPTEPSATC